MFQLKNKLNKEDCVKQLMEEALPRVTLSFYKYVRIPHPRDFRDALFREWSDLGVLGRIYVSKEGVNAQINVPEHQMEAFQASVDANEYLQGSFLNLAIEHNPSFYKLCIKLRKQIVTDGLEDSEVDLSQTGNHLSAEAFNQAMEEGAIVVDMRNFYESRIGHFEGALCPDSVTFKEELPMVLEELKGKEEAKVLMYCTGGIRCEKASAYLKNHGFKDVNQLQGGIIHYAHQVKEKGLDNKFKGSNFVFDERLSERVTDEILTECDQCDTKCDTYTNCTNAACNLLFIQCGPCMKKMEGACTPECQAIAALPEAERKAYYAQQKSSTYDLYKSRIRPSLKIQKQSLA